jgi:hypothetical protein
MINFNLYLSYVQVYSESIHNKNNSNRKLS